MRVFFLGSLIDQKNLDKIIRKSRIKASNAPVYFQNMFIKGIISAGVEVKIYSVPPISAFPGSSKLLWGMKKSSVGFNQLATWLPTLNIQIFKQFSIFTSSFVALVVWLIKNRYLNDKKVICYSIYPPYSYPIVILNRFFNYESVAIISDLPAYLYHLRKSYGIRKFLSFFFTKRIVKIQDKFNKYIFLTKYMAKAMKIEEKPSIVLEGFSDPDLFANILPSPKNQIKTLMYAGALNTSFGIEKLIKAFMITEGNFELWLFGAGDCEKFIIDSLKQDKRIKFFGKVDREELLKAQLQSHILISIKPTSENHSNYAFPSKIIEYMSSGTPVMSTKVGGIPDDYFNYLIPIKDKNIKEISTRISVELNKSEELLNNLGEKMKNYVLTNKNFYMQGLKIKKFLDN